MRHTNTTAKDMVASGAWAKVGKKSYRHESGREVRFDGAMWDVDGQRYAALWIAKMIVEQESGVDH